MFRYKCSHVIECVGHITGTKEIIEKRTKPHSGPQMGHVLNSNCQRERKRQDDSKILYVINQGIPCVFSRHTGHSRICERRDWLDFGSLSYAW